MSSYLQTAVERHPRLGPFTRPVAQPIVTPDSTLTFHCPMRQQAVRWAANHTFNPAAVVFQDQIHLLFRSEDGVGDEIGAYTSRIGHATSVDGITFALQPTPVIYPADDEYKGYEWYGGCEDPRVVQRSDGLFALYYTMWNHGNPVGTPVLARIGVATSWDLQQWSKHGPIFAEAPVGNMLHQWHKAASVVQAINDGQLVAAQINGRYWMYWGEHAVYLATSPDLIHWTPVLDADGALLQVIAPRPGKFDSLLTEVGPPAVITDDGIVLIYNGKNGETPAVMDPHLGPGAYAPGQLLLDKADPTKVLQRSDAPFLQPELPFERTGQYQQGTVFTEGLVLYKGTWYLYYGTADTYVGVATAPLGS
ncbi:MAG: pesticidal protein Cry15Aa [Caldilinea sp. CFX5]|nr:pesticidal protein Cry15Aa [Caldilinea sp. CFX5]